MRFFFASILVSCLSFWIKAQHTLTTKVTEQNQEFELAIKQYNGPIRDSINLQQTLTQIKLKAYEKGYLLSSAELNKTDTTYQLTIDLGSKVYSKKFKLEYPPNVIPPIPAEVLNEQSKADTAFIRKQILYYLQFLENNGYPFASIETKGFELKNDSLQTTLYINPGPLITIDSVVIKGFDNFSSRVLKYDFRFRKGMLYNESYLNRLPQMAEQVEYLNMTRAPAMAFSKSKSTMYLYIEEQKSNQIDGVIGLNTESDGKVVFTGDINLRLLHVLHKGEELKLRWRRPDESVQALNFDLKIPYLFKTPLWLDTKLSIFRQDSTFVNTQISGILKYTLESGSFISGGVDYKSSNLLQSNNIGIDYQSYSTVLYKLGLELQKTNRIIVPTKGYQIAVFGLTGKRTATEANTEQHGWDIEAAKWINLYKRHVVMLKLRSEALFGGSLFTNENYRIGGLKSIRGFNEQSIYASKYAIGALEYRYMIGRYDYITAFADLGYVENNSSEQINTTWLTGLGAGINFQTNAGVFSFYYAIGKDDDNPFDFRTSKIHFGYTNRF